MSEDRPITGELRETIRSLAIDDSVLTIGGDDFHHLCDAIDAVHASLEAENAGLRAILDGRDDSMHETDAWRLGYDEGFASAGDWMADNADAMAEHGWVRLPKDANGETIHVGDVVIESLPFGGESKPLAVDRMELCKYDGEDVWAVALDTNEASWAQPPLLRHYHAPTVEDVLREMHAELDEVTALYVGEAIDSDERDRDEARIFAKYAAKLRLAGDAE